jgi:hypothetical protein
MASVLVSGTLFSLRAVLVASMPAAPLAEHVHGDEDPAQDDPETVIRKKLCHDCYSFSSH